MGSWKVGKQERDLRTAVPGASDPGCGEESCRERYVRGLEIALS